MAALLALFLLPVGIAAAAPPVADAGPDQTQVQQFSIITLDGTGSTDPDSPLAYSWIQTAGPAVTLVGANTSNPSFTAPAGPATLIFELGLYDGTDSDADTVTITVNGPPDAYAGPTQRVQQGSTVTLNGTGSSDPEMDTLTYSWIQTAGPAVTLTGANTANPTFTAPSPPAVLMFQLTVRDATDADTDTVSIAVNRPPTADAGPDQTIAQGSTVALDGTGSSDPDGDALTYSWVQTAGPAVTLTGATTANPTFTAPSPPATLEFELTVNDGISTDTDTVSLPVNGFPTADAGPDQPGVQRGSTITLDGTGSTDPDGNPLTYSWIQTGGGTVVTLTGANTAQPSFTAPAGPDVLVFELTASDGINADTDSVSISVNGGPTADAGPDQTVLPSSAVTLDGSGSTDPDGNPLTYSWVQTAGLPVTLTGANTAAPNFTAPAAPSALTFELTVDDGTDIDTDTVTITVGLPGQAPTADAGPDQTVPSSSAVALDGSGSSDPDNDPLAYSWTQTAGPAVALTGANTASPTFNASAPGALVFRLTVDDGSFTDADTVTVTVAPANRAPTADAGPDQTVQSSTVATLDGSASRDPDGDPLTYRWTQTSGPAATLTGANTATPSFTAPAPGTLVFQLTVSDGALTDTDTTEITVTDAAATLLIAEQLATRGTLVLMNQPDIQRRIDRLNGVSTGSTGITDLLAMVPTLAEGGGASVHGSLAGFAGRTGREDTRFDVWFDARYSKTQGDSLDGSFAMGTLGADYLVNPNLLAGAFISVDHLSMEAAAGPAKIAGTGWLAGGYLTGRLSQNLYLDGTVAAGTSSNSVNPAGTYTDAFATTRVLAAATLTGEWEHGNWTFLPRARLSWFGERSAAYTDTLGVAIPSVTQNTAEVTAGPGFVWTHLTEDGTRIAPALRFDAVGRLSSNNITGTEYTLSGRVEPRVDITTPGGLSLGVGGTVEFGDGQLTYGGSARLSFGFN